MNAENALLVRLPKSGCDEIRITRSKGGWKVRVIERPPCDRKATVDTFSDFLASCCEIQLDGEGSWRFESKGEDLRNAYEAWCARQKIAQKISPVGFGRKLSGRGIPSRKSNGVMVYKGVRLRLVGLLTEKLFQGRPAARE